MKKYRIIILALVLILVLGIGYFFDKKFRKFSISNLQKSPETSTSASISTSPQESQTPESPLNTPLPDSYLIKNFSFQSQAPYANWDELHDEACEEASLILVKYYFEGKQVSADMMENDIQKMVTWEIQKYGTHKDLTISETGNMASNFYGLTNWEIKKINTIEDIKTEISKNHPVIVPTAGRLLGNPNFRSPGPIYHMVVIIGYEENRIIVQDVGTRRGDHYEYSEKILMNAIHDWNGSPENIEGGVRKMLVFN